MEKELKNALKILEEESLLLYPTDTVWGIGCDSTSIQAIQKIYRLKRRRESKALICLVSDFEMLQKYVQIIPENLKKILDKQTKPTTVIYTHPKGVAKNLVASDDTLAIRICKNIFCQKLIQAWGKPIVSTSANISGEATPKNFSQISSKIKGGVDYIVNLQRETRSSEPSKIIKIESDGSIKTIRE